VSDIVEQLRASVTQCRAVDRSALLAAAADEIERLRLTDAEREAIEQAIEFIDENSCWQPKALRGLLKRLG
jgi:hypothetical protein